MSSMKLCCKETCQDPSPHPQPSLLLQTPTCSSVSHSPQTYNGLPQSADSQLVGRRALGAAAFHLAHTAKRGSQQHWCWAWPHPILLPEPSRPGYTAVVGQPPWSSTGPGAPGASPPAKPHSGPLASGVVWPQHMVHRYTTLNLAALRGSRSLHLEQPGRERRKWFRRCEGS